MSNAEGQLNVVDIMGYLPHRYPFLLVDRVLEIGEDKIIGIKNVTINENFFQGHFPGDPIMPGVLLVEGMAQCGGMLVLQRIEEGRRKELATYFTGIDKVRFKRAVRPGDQIRYEVELPVLKGSEDRMLGKMIGKVFIGDELACSAEMKAMIFKRQ